MICSSQRIISKGHPILFFIFKSLLKQNIKKTHSFLLFQIYSQKKCMTRLLSHIKNQFDLLTASAVYTLLCFFPLPIEEPIPCRDRYGVKERTILTRYEYPVDKDGQAFEVLDKCTLICMKINLTSSLMS